MTRSTGSAPARDAPFAPLPDSARLWVFGAGRPLSDHEERRLLEAVDGFLEAWRAHGHPLAAAREWRHRRFLLVAVDDRVVPPSGCSIDALVHALKGLEEQMGVELVGGAPVWYRSGEEIRRVSREAFRDAASRGEVTPETVVFDPAVTRVEELRAGRWERPAREGWHRRYLPS